jgi:hypothetical protein
MQAGQISAFQKIDAASFPALAFVSCGFSLKRVRMKRLAILLLLPLSVLRLPAERINQEGRILGALPVVTNAILFNTNDADAVVSAMQIFPVTNPWNECISNRPVLANSEAMLAQMMFDFTNGLAGSSIASHLKLHINWEMNYVLVPDSQMLVSNQFVMYPDDSDLNGGIYPYGLYPIPTNQPIEGWPLGLIANGTPQTLLQWQTNNDGSDRHSIMVQPGKGTIFETWNALRVGTNWQAANGAIFNLNTNGLRPAGLTSGDAAGLQMFPALVRYDEAERGMVEHALRITVKKSRYNNYIYPATHFAAPAGNTSTNLPSMGQRLRLKAAFVIPANWTQEEKAVALALKKYGALVADNGSILGISVAPDDRWPNGVNCFSDLLSLVITNFEVIQTTGTNEGPRSAGAPAANAGPDQAVPAGPPVQLQGVVTFSNSPPVIQWNWYSGPGTVTFGNAALTNTTANFSAPGTYTVELGADDGVHAVAYDAVVITVTNVITVSIARAGTNVNVNWSGGVAPYVVQRAGALPPTWSDVVTTGFNSTNLPMTNASGFFRVRGQ